MKFVLKIKTSLTLLQYTVHHLYCSYTRPNYKVIYWKVGRRLSLRLIILLLTSFKAPATVTKILTRKVLSNIHKIQYLSPLEFVIEAIYFMYLVSSLTQNQTTPPILPGRSQRNQLWIPQGSQH